MSVDSTKIEFLFRLSAAILVTECSLMVLGNLFVFYVFYRTKSLRTEANYLILALAFTDLLYGTLLLPHHIANVAQPYPNTEFSTGPTGCLVFSFSVGLCSTMSVVWVPVIAYYRYVKIVRWKKPAPKRFTTYLIVCSVIFSVATAIASVTWGRYERTEYLSACLPAWAATDPGGRSFSVFMLVYVLTLVSVTAYCYFRIISFMHRARREGGGANSNPTTPRGGGGGGAMAVMRNAAYHKERAITRRMTFLVVAIALWYTPVTILLLMGTLAGQRGSVEFELFAGLCVVTSSVTNPVLYAIISPRFRTAYAAVLCGSGARVGAREMQDSAQLAADSSGESRHVGAATFGTKAVVGAGAGLGGHNVVSASRFMLPGRRSRTSYQQPASEAPGQQQQQQDGVVLTTTWDGHSSPTRRMPALSNNLQLPSVAAATNRALEHARGAVNSEMLSPVSPSPNLNKKGAF